MLTKFRSLLFACALTCLVTWLSAEQLQVHPVAAWIGAINLLTFLYMGRDKFAASHKLGRTPESTLLMLACAGGFPGLFTGRRLFNHKTSKKSFVITMWLLFAAQLGAAGWYFQDLEKLGLERKERPTTEVADQHLPQQP